MQLSEIVDTSKRVAQTRSRSAKIEHLTACLRSFPVVEIEIGVAYLIGDLPQGRIGIGYSVIKKALPGTAATNATNATLRARAKITSHISRPDLDDPIEQNRRTSPANLRILRLTIVQRWPEDGMRKA